MVKMAVFDLLKSAKTDFKYNLSDVKILKCHIASTNCKQTAARYVLLIFVMYAVFTAPYPSNFS